VGSLRHALGELWRRRQVRLFLSDLDELLARPGFGRGMSERAVEIPWALSRVQRQRRVLDVGYAHAKWAYLYALRRKEIPELHGLDLDSRRVPWMETAAGDIRKTSYPDGFFELVLCISTIEHVGRDLTGWNVEGKQETSGDAAALREIARILAPGGRALITVPFGKYEDHGFQIQYDEERWRALAVSAPLKFSAEEYFRYADGWRRSSREELAGVGYRTNGAPYAAGLLCAEGVKPAE